MKNFFVVTFSAILFLGLSACDENTPKNQAKGLQGKWICGSVNVQFDGFNVVQTINGTKMGDLINSGTFDFLDGKFRVQFRNIRRTFTDPLQKVYAIRAIADSGDMLGAQTLLRDGYQDIPSNILVISNILKLDETTLLYQEITEYRDGVPRPAVGSVECRKTQ